MSKEFREHIGAAAVLMEDNVDTDQIIPSREMKTVSRTGLGEGLFAGLRYSNAEQRVTNPDFVLNRPGYENVSILISGANFGCGSSREHAVWALKEYGFRAIIAKSFGEIFYGNCLSNGVLPIILDDPNFEDLDTPVEIHINLPEQSVSCSAWTGWQREFEIDSYPKKLLLEGLDPIGLTLRKSAEIEAFIKDDSVSRPWLYQAG